MKSKFSKEGKSQEDIIKRLESLKGENTNFSCGRVLGSMCTEPFGVAEKAYQMFLESNLGNPGLYPGTKKLEKKVHEIVGDLINAEGMESLSVGGGTEGNIMGLWRAREKSGKKKVLLPKSAHFSFEKACSLLDMESEYVPLTDDYKVDLSALEKKIDEETAAVVGIAGTTEHGAIDPIKYIAELTGDIHLHVDAAFGGFVIPFLKDMGYELPSFDFNIRGVDSISLDPHKMGMSPVPLGLFYSKGKEEITIDSPYLTSDKQKSIRGTRASASIPAFWATLEFLGEEGYKEIISNCMENTHHLVDRMKEIGLEPSTEPTLNIASFKYEDPEQIVAALSEKGWYISRTVHPKGLRFVVMPHVTEDSIDQVTELLRGLI